MIAEGLARSAGHTLAQKYLSPEAAKAARLAYAEGAASVLDFLVTRQGLSPIGWDLTKDLLNEIKTYCQVETAGL